ncbi:hypothetical protein CYLTODRAFT_419486 [Cylindrobasidium torrendii FP15055 ss-10]|uniref:Shr3 amino acid permease chaperone n=1 Tax=Cylindrobasidium torrendii FP15055 ss-10 TaxID=1314674 RepID=A0A0D7BK17_9AGAR|nr:hypothetical protein CYLTODRAFT_419486 [Cylindrobasidium torrendii FP15055 ss-10]
MGFRHALVLGPVSFFIGILFVCLTVDQRILWGEFTDAVREDGFQFYATFYKAPTAIKNMLHGFGFIGLVGLISKLHKWDESAMFFDGSCIGAYVFALAVYFTVTLPTLRTVVEPLAEDSVWVRGEALRVLSAGNIIIALCLGAILVMQAGQEYAHRTDLETVKAVEASEKVKKTE